MWLSLWYNFTNGTWLSLDDLDDYLLAIYLAPQTTFSGLLSCHQDERKWKFPFISVLRYESRCFHFGIFEIFVSSFYLLAISTFCKLWYSVLYKLKAHSQEVYHGADVCIFANLAKNKGNTKQRLMDIGALHCSA